METAELSTAYSKYGFRTVDSERCWEASRSGPSLLLKADSFRPPAFRSRLEVWVPNSIGWEAIPSWRRASACTLTWKEKKREEKYQDQSDLYQSNYHRVVHGRLDPFPGWLSWFCDEDRELQHVATRVPVGKS
jgi:hypothetical protein